MGFNSLSGRKWARRAPRAPLAKRVFSDIKRAPFAPRSPLPPKGFIGPCKGPSGFKRRLHRIPRSPLASTGLFGAQGDTWPEGDSGGTSSYKASSSLKRAYRTSKRCLGHHGLLWHLNSSSALKSPWSLKVLTVPRKGSSHLAMAHRA